MFEAAYKVAQGFTRPIVISSKTVSGACSSGIGAFVIINDEGWFVTAAHIVKTVLEGIQEESQTRATLASRAAVLADPALDHKERKKRLQAHPAPPATAIERFSPWWGADGWAVNNVFCDHEVDVAVGQLENFDPNQVPAFPVFKDPSKDISPGRSLCKLGYPFHEIVPTWDAQNNVFKLPPESLPLPQFPIDGILTRLVQLESPDPQPPYPRQLIETSTPGLRGQSGGPTFDVNGTVWAIQSKTVHQPLGFDPPVPGKPNQREHQFINLGWGVHCATVIGILNHLNVRHTLANY